MKRLKMNKFPSVSVCIVVLLSLTSMPTTAKGRPTLSAKQIVANMTKQFDMIKDYTVDVKAVVDGPTVHIPDMRARLCYKRPNKLKVESEDGFAVVPKQGLVTESTIRDMVSASELDLVGEAHIDGFDCYVIKVTFRKNGQSIPSVVWVDKKYRLIRQIHNNPDFGNTTRISILYTRVANKYWLPRTTTAKISYVGFPNASVEDNEKSTRPTTITVTFSNYRVNTGLKDTIFDKQERGM